MSARRFCHGSPEWSIPLNFGPVAGVLLLSGSALWPRPDGVGWGTGRPIKTGAVVRRAPRRNLRPDLSIVAATGPCFGQLVFRTAEAATSFWLTGCRRCRFLDEKARPTRQHPVQQPGARAWPCPPARAAKPSEFPSSSAPDLLSGSKRGSPARRGRCALQSPFFIFLQIRPLTASWRWPFVAANGRSGFPFMTKTTVTSLPIVLVIASFDDPGLYTRASRRLSPCLAAPNAALTLGYRFGVISRAKDRGGGTGTISSGWASTAV